MAIADSPKVGDIHKYFANSIEEVRFSRGFEHPIRTEVLMSTEVGLFQVEEVLLGKMAAGTAKSYMNYTPRFRTESLKDIYKPIFYIGCQKEAHILLSISLD